MKLNNIDLKRIQLKKQLLHFQTEEKISMTTVLRNLGYVQLDSINITNARSQDIFFRSRTRNYQTNDYLKLYNIGFQEVYLHALSLVPSDNILVPIFQELSSHRLKNLLGNKTYEHFFMKKKGEYLNRKKSNNWDLTDEGRVINLLWRSGKIGVTRDKNFKKILDFSIQTNKHFFSDNLDLHSLWIEQLILMAFDNIGIATFNDIKNYFRLTNKDVKPIFGNLLQKKIICSLGVSGSEELFILSKEVPYLDEEIIREDTPMCTFLSPFDNLIRDRKRLVKLFDFDYTLESYIKKEKRVYGYYALPILIDEDIVGVIDLKMNRKENVLNVENLIFNSKYSKAKHSDVVLAELKSFTNFVKADKYSLSDSVAKYSFGL